MQKTILITIFVLCGVSVCLAHQQQSQQQRRKVTIKQTRDKHKIWTLQQCIGYAIRNNVNIKQMEQSRENKAVALNTSRNAWLPSASASIGENLDIGRSPSKDGTIKDQSSTNSNFYLQTSMPIFDGFKIKNDIEAKKWDVRAATESLKKAKEDIAINVLTYYMQVLYKREIERIAEEQISLCKNQIERTQLLVGNGKIAKSQLYDMEAQLANDEVTLTKARNDVSLAILDLMQAMELDDEYEHDFEIAVPETKKIIDEYLDNIAIPETIYNDALDMKPQLKEQEYLLKSLRKNLNVAKADYFPTVSLSASYSNYYYHYSGFDNLSFSEQWNQNSRKTIGLTLSIPLFNRFQVRNNVRSAQIAIINQELTIEDTRKTLYREIRQAYANAVAAQETYKSTLASVASTYKSLEYAKESYEAGKTSVFEFNEAKSKYIQSRSEQIQAKYDFVLRCKILDFYGGLPIVL